MTDFTKQHSDEWTRHFIDQGYSETSPLAAGVEGAIYRLGNGLLAKVWGARSAEELGKMQSLYGDIKAVTLPFATPTIVDIQRVNGFVVTYERELPGVPLADPPSYDSPTLKDQDARCIADVLRGLAMVPATPGMRSLAVLDEDRPFWDGSSRFCEALTRLLERRLGRFGDLLRQHVHDMDHLYAVVTSELDSLVEMPPTVVHGDLFPENVLVDEDARPVAVIDFGFMSTAGDPRFDAAVSGAIYNMYGDHARDLRWAMTTMLAAELGYDVHALVLFQAAYAFATSNAFTADGSDGHFAWCVDLLNDPSTREVLGSR
jgi:hypothetical protein